MKNLTINVGDYVRTKLGIGKLIEITDDEYIFDKPVGTYINYFEFDYINEIFIENANKVIIKSSPNIIDLIEIGDYVNGEKVDFVGIIENWGNKKILLDRNRKYKFRTNIFNSNKRTI